MDKIISAYDIAKSNTIKGDFIDRLHSKYTVIFLFTTCILVGLRQYDKKAIACWLPNQFSDEQGKFFSIFIEHFLNFLTELNFK